MGLPSLASSQLELEQAGNRLDHHHGRSLGSPVRELTLDSSDLSLLCPGGIDSSEGLHCH